MDFADPMASRQKWTCTRKDCWKKYKAGYGMIVQMRLRGIEYFIRAECKDWDARDLQACMIEDVHSAYKTPEEVYAALERIRPTNFGDLFRQATVAEVNRGVGPTATYIVRSQELMNNMPEFTWEMIFSVVKQQNQSSSA